MFRGRRLLILILSVGLLLRLGYVLTLEPTIKWYDGTEYYRLAHSLLNDRAYLAPDGRPTAYWPPGYPAFLALFAHGVTSARLLQAVMGGLTVLLVYGIARRFHNRRKSLLASAIVAVYPLQIFAAGVHYPVVLQTLLVAAIIWLLLGAVQQTSRRGALFAGLLGGVAALTAPSIVPALCLAALWLLWEGRGRRRLQLPVLFAVPIILMVGTWTVRNYQCFHSLVPVSLNAGYDFWLGNFPGTRAATGNREVPGRDLEERALRAAHPGEAELNRAYFRKAIEHIRADPRRFAVLTAYKALYLWHVFPDPMTESMSTKRKLACLFSYGLLLPFGLYWVLRNVTRSPGARLILFFFVSYTLVHAVSLSKVRFRLPLDTLLVVMAVGGLGDLARRLGFGLLEEQPQPVRAPDHINRGGATPVPSGPPSCQPGGELRRHG